MPAATATELRVKAEHFRRITEDGVDRLQVNALLLQLAEEFDQEAARMDALEADRTG